MLLQKQLFCRCYGKYTLVPNYLWNFDGDVKDDNGTSKLQTGHEFNAESIFEVVFVDKGDKILTGDIMVKVLPAR